MLSARGTPLGGQLVLLLLASTAGSTSSYVLSRAPRADQRARQIRSGKRLSATRGTCGSTRMCEISEADAAAASLGMVAMTANPATVSPCMHGTRPRPFQMR